MKNLAWRFPSWGIFPGAFLVASGLFFLFSWRTAFHVTYNDFWGILFYARQLNWQEKASLYNGFYPIGYALLLRLLPYGLVIQGITLINVTFGGLFSAAATGLVRRAGSLWIALLVFAFSVSYPLGVEYASSVAPEIGCAAFTALAVFLLWDDLLAPAGRPASIWKLTLAGALLGLATLWRSHTLASSLAIVAAYLFLVSETPLKGKIGLLAGFLALGSVQVGVNLFSGHGPLETAQSFNLYKLFNLVDWRRMPSPAEVASFSLWKTFLASPSSVLLVYFPWFFQVLAYALPAVLGWISFPKSVYRRFWLFTALGITAYALIVAWGASRRAPLVISSLALVSAAFWCVEFLAFVRRKAPAWLKLAHFGLVTLSLLALSGLTWVNLDYLNFSRAQDENIRGLTEILLKAGLKSPEEVFTDSFAVYFPGLPPYAPRAFGGWNEVYLWKYNQVYPLLPFDSAAAFDQACQAQGIRFLILTPKSAESADFLFRLYSTGQVDGLDNFELLRKFGNFKIFRRR